MKQIVSLPTDAVILDELGYRPLAKTAARYFFIWSQNSYGFRPRRREIAGPERTGRRLCRASTEVWKGSPWKGKSWTLCCSCRGNLQSLSSKGDREGANIPNILKVSLF